LGSSSGSKKVRWRGGVDCSGSCFFCPVKDCSEVGSEFLDEMGEEDGFG